MTPLHEIKLQRISNTEKGLPLSEPYKDAKTPTIGNYGATSPVLKDNPKLRKELFELHDQILKKNAKDFP